MALREAIGTCKLGPGFLVERLDRVQSATVVQMIFLPLSVDTLYVGSGSDSVYPSAWSNPFAHSSLSEAQAEEAFSRSRL